MKTLGKLVQWFLYITVGIVIVCGVNYTMAGIEAVDVDIFWKILLSAFVTSLATVLILPNEHDGNGKSRVRFVLHNVALCVIMSVFGVWFGWIDFNLTGIGVMVMDVGLVYLIAAISYYIVNVKQADEINRVLQEKFGDEKV
ncbi:MAG: DUF3021 family protein [Eubacterium sp.]|nr:DUF3021 family protein [Eubacterium sp.]